jgi:hypothetical protein
MMGTTNISIAYGLYVEKCFGLEPLLHWRGDLIEQV